MTRRQAQARALIWSLTVVGGVLLVISLSPLDGAGSAAGAGQATTSSTPTPTPTPTPPPTPAPTPTPPPTPAPTLGPPITVGPPITQAPAPTYQQSTSSVEETTTSNPSTTTLPELLVPAPPDRPVETTTTEPPVDGDDEGISSSAKLGLAVGGLLTSAAAIATLSVVYFFKTRPGEEEELGDASQVEDAAGEGSAAHARALSPSLEPDEVPDPDRTRPDLPVASAPSPEPDEAGGIAALTALLAESEDSEPGPDARPTDDEPPTAGSSDAPTPS